jgi:hypothetical protein
METKCQFEQNVSRSTLTFQPNMGQLSFPRFSITIRTPCIGDPEPHRRTVGLLMVILNPTAVQWVHYGVLLVGIMNKTGSLIHKNLF